MLNIKTVTTTILDWWLHYEFCNVGLFRPQQQSWTKRKLLLISGRILLCQVCFWRKTLLPYNIPTFKIWRFKVEQGERKRQIYLQHWWTTLGFQQLLLKDLWQWIVPNLYQALSCQSLSRPLILERFLTISKGGMSEISISFMGVAPLLKLWNNILLWKFVEIIIISSMCD